MSRNIDPTLKEAFTAVLELASQAVIEGDTLGECAIEVLTEYAESHGKITFGWDMASLPPREGFSTLTLIMDTAYSPPPRGRK